MQSPPNRNFNVSYVLNLLDRESDDIAYWFESQLPHEPAGVEDIHFHPANPRAIRVLLKYKF